MGKRYAAPGELEFVRAFVNSPESESHLWLERSGVAPGHASTDDVGQVRALREALLHELLSHTGDCGYEPEQTWPALATLLAGHGLEVVFDAPGRLRLEPRAGVGLPSLRGAIASRVYDAVLSGEWRRLKACRKPSCRFAFYDRSKNGSGAWCDMAICGNRVKAQRRRAKTRRFEALGTSD